jgi:hypothetical protein
MLAYENDNGACMGELVNLTEAAHFLRPTAEPQTVAIVGVPVAFAVEPSYGNQLASRRSRHFLFVVFIIERINVHLANQHRTTAKNPNSRRSSRQEQRPNA